MARNFNGGTDELHFVVTPQPNNVGSVSFWMRTTQTTTNTAVVTFWSSTSRTGWGFLLNNTANKIAFNAYSPGGQTILLTSPANINDGNPHHIAVNYSRFSAAACTLFVDGSQVATAASSAGWGAATGGFFLQAGKNLDPFWGAYVGDIWELAQWFGGNLTADEIAALAKGYSPKVVHPALLDTYAPLVRDVIDLRNSYAATSTGGSIVPHGRREG